MSIQVTITIPDRLYALAEKLAKSRQQNVQAVLLSELTKSISSSDDFRAPSDDEIALEYEKKAYHSLHSQLWNQYPGQHVAIHNGQLIDSDQDGIALSHRIYAKYPEEFVLIRKVDAMPERTLRFRSPRITKNAASNS